MRYLPMRETERLRDAFSSRLCPSHITAYSTSSMTEHMARSILRGYFFEVIWRFTMWKWIREIF